MDIYQIIENDHRSLRDLARQVCDIEHNDANRRTALFAEFRERLTAHLQGKEESFYASLMTHAIAREEAEHAFQEHDELLRIFDRLDEFAESSQEWLAWFMRLKQMLEHHFRLEEGATFFLARDLLTPQEADMLGHYMLNRCRRREEHFAAAA